MFPRMVESPINIDLAAFGLNALATLSTGSATAARSGFDNSDFLNVLLNARSSLPGAAAGDAVSVRRGGLTS